MSKSKKSLPLEKPMDRAHSSTEVLTSEEFRADLNKVVYGYLGPASAGLLILYLILATLHLWVLSDAIRWIMFVTALSTALICGLFYILIHKKALPTAWGNRILAGFALLTILNSAMHLVLSQESRQTTNFVLIILIASFFILSTRWLLCVVGIVWGSWLTSCMIFPFSDVEHFTIMILQGTVLGGIAHVAQIKNHRQKALTLKILASAKQHLNNRTLQLEETTQEIQQQIAERIHANDLLRQFVKNAPAPIAMVDRHMNYLLYSKRWLKDFHLGDRDRTGQCHYDLFPNIPAHWKEIHQQCLTGKTEQCDEEPFRRENGFVDWLRWEIHPWYERNGTVGGIIMFVEMITARKYAEAELRRSEERFRHFFNLSLIGNCILNLQGHFLEVNDCFCDLSGYTHDELCHITFKDLTHPDDLHLSDHSFQQLIAGKIEGYSVVKRYFKKSGAIIHATASIRSIRGIDGSIDYLVGNVVDITDRVLVEKAHRESEERLQDFLDNANDLVQSVNPDGKFLYVNQAWKKTLGYSDEELRHLNLMEIIHPDNLLHCTAIFRSVIQGKTISNCETVFISKEGKRIAVQGSINCRIESGQPTATRAIFRDITEYKQAAQELQQAKERAEEANRAKSLFLANMSHELRTPLNSVIGFANILTKNKWNNLLDRDLNYIHKIQSNGTHLLNLINDILDLSKVEAGRMELQLTPISLDHLIHDTIAQMEGQLRGKPLTLKAEVPPHLPSIETDAGKLRQILINLIGNAIKFTDSGSVRICVAVNPATSAPCRIDVIDSGIGISPDRQNIVFEAFHQADSTTARKYGGTGLGLAICRSFCQLLGYSISLQSREGQGSTFSIHLEAS